MVVPEGSTRPLAPPGEPATGAIKSPAILRPTERAERIAQRANNTFSRLAVLSMILNFVLVLVVLKLSNEPPSVFLLSESNGRFYQARGPVEDADVMKTLMEKFARRYVLQRETVNRVDDLTRFEWVKNNSTRRVWEQFNALMSDQGFYSSAIQNKTSWTVNVASVWQSNESNKFIWSLEIIKTYYQKGRQRGAPEAWVIEMRMDRDGRLKTPAEQLDNPAALYVAAYTAREKEAVVKGQDQ